MSRWNSNIALLLMSGFIATLLLLQPACNEDTKDMVTITGHVRNADSGDLIWGARVSLLDTNFEDVQPTGTDGKYVIHVPKGSKLYLVTDDFDPGADLFFPMINADAPAIVANEDISGWPIHACPRTSCSIDGKGSLATWNEYLKYRDESNGDLFVPTSVDSSGGVLSLVFWFCEGNSDPGEPGMNVVSDTPAFPIGYVICNENSPPACTADFPIFYPASRTTTDDWGWACSFGDPSFTGKYIHLTITDTDTTRQLPFPDMEIPVRPGMTTLVWAVAIDGVPSTFRELGPCLDLFDPGQGKPTQGPGLMR